MYFLNKVIWCHYGFHNGVQLCHFIFIIPHSFLFLCIHSNIPAPQELYGNDDSGHHIVWLRCVVKHGLVPMEVCRPQMVCWEPHG